MSRVFQNIDTPHPPVRPASVSSPPPTPQQRRGVHTRRAERGVEVNILEGARHRIALLQKVIISLRSIVNIKVVQCCGSVTFMYGS
jgi:hypothetical protein